MKSIYNLSKRRLWRSLTAQVAASLLVMALVAFSILATTLYLAGQMKKDGVVVDLAGSERMRAYKLSSLIHTLVHGREDEARESKAHRRALIEEEIRAFEAILSGLRDGSPAYGLPAASTDEIVALIDTVMRRWRTVMKPALLAVLGATSAEESGLRLAEYEDQVSEFVGSINEIVGLLAAQSSRKVESLHRIDYLLLTLLLVTGVGTGYLLHRFTVKPLLAVASAATAMGGGDLSRRSGVAPSALIPAEVGELARAFDEMAEALSEKNRHLSFLHRQVAVALTSSLSLNDVLNQIMSHGISVSGAKATCIAFYDEPSGRFKEWLTQGLSDHFVGNMAFRPGGLADETFTSRTYVLSNDRPETKHKLSRLAREEGIRAFICLPLIGHERELGVIYFYRNDRDTFTPDEIELLTTFAHLAAGAIDNSRLFEEAQSQRVRLTQIFDSANDAIISADSDGRIIAWNKGAQAIFGWSEKEVWCEPLTLLIPERYRDAHQRGMERMRSGGEPRVVGKTVELHGLRKDGGEFPLELSLTSWKTRDGTFYTAIIRDITERKRVEQMKSDFISFATHQLRTPLAGIKWLLELAAQGDGISPETRSYIQDTRDSAERLIGLVNDLLDISRLENGKLAVALKETDLHELTRSVLDEVKTLVEEKGHQLSFAGNGEIPPVWADPQLLRQVILNLVSNAIKYTPPGGKMEVWMEREDSSVLWAIRDNGIGIPKEAQGRLFEKFYRADNAQTIHTEGTGLGLYLARLIVERLGGRIWCESEEGEGTTFLLKLPLSE